MTKFSKTKQGPRPKPKMSSDGQKKTSKSSASSTNKSNRRDPRIQKQQSLKHRKNLKSKTAKFQNNQKRNFKHDRPRHKPVKKTPDFFHTFSSDLLECSNKTIAEKLQRYWLNKANKNNELCAVLAAVANVLKQKSSEECITVYFDALLNALSTVEEVESMSAVGYLLSEIVNEVSRETLCNNFEHVSTLLSNILKKFAACNESDAPTALLRAILSTLAIVLQNQEVCIWELASAIDMLPAILFYVKHSKPKIRKAAQNALCYIISTNSNSISNHPVAFSAANFCISHLKNLDSISEDAVVCHILQMLGRILHCLSTTLLQEVCEVVLNTIALGNIVVKLACYQTFNEMFNNWPSECHLPIDLISSIMLALYDYYPSSSDLQPCLEWVKLGGKILLHLCIQYIDTSYEDEAGNLAIVHIPKLFYISFKFMLASSTAAERVSTTFSEILKNGVSKIWKQKEVVISSPDEIKFVSSLFKTLSEGLKVNHRNSWNHVLQIAEILFFAIVNKSHVNIVKSFLENMVDLHLSEDFEFTKELNSAVARAILSLGSKQFLQVVPLQINDPKADNKFPRAWLLPILKDNAKETELRHFSEHFFPAAAYMRLKAEEYKNAKLEVDLQACNSMYLQIWNLFPSFCREAVDIHDTFPKIARVLGNALSDPKLQLIAADALCNIINCSKANEKDELVVSNCAKNFLPILFNIYTSKKITSGILTNHVEGGSEALKVKSDKRVQFLKTIQLYAATADKSLVCMYFSEVLNKVLTTTQTNVTCLVLLDLLSVLVAHITADLLTDLYEKMPKMLENEDINFQARTYKILKEICNSHSSFVQEKISELKDILLNGLKKAPSITKGMRIKCLENIYTQLHSDVKTKDESENFLKETLPVVTLCTRSAAECRVDAFDFIKNTAQLYTSDKSSDSLNRYFEIVLIGFSGEAMRIRGTIVALTCLVYEFKDQISSPLLNQIITNICSLFGCNTTEVVQVAFGFITSLLNILSENAFEQYLPDIFNAFQQWRDHTICHFRFKLKTFLNRLVQKFGYEKIHSMTPEKFKIKLPKH